MTAIKANLEQWAMKDKAKYDSTIKQIQQLEITWPKPLKQFFEAIKEIILNSVEFEKYISTDVKGKSKYSVTQLKELQDKYYHDLSLTPVKAYAKCYGNPDWTVKTFGNEMGKLISNIYAEIRKYRHYLIQKKYTELARLNELVIKLHKDGLDCLKATEMLRKIITKDMDKQQLWGLFWRFSPEQDYYKNIVLNADLNNLNYLYRYGVYISEHELKMAEFLQKYPEQELKKLSQYIVKSYEDGFERGMRTYKTKKYTTLMIPAGMERLARLIIKDLQKIGLEAVVSCPMTQSYNKQYDYDHRFDMALFYDKEYVDLMIPAYEKAVNSVSDVMKLHAGPIYVELFGETPFAPTDKETALKFNNEQLQLRRVSGSKTTQIFYQHYKQEETSFCIIAFPSTEIGQKFEEIFSETVKLNMLDSMKYAKIQQQIIDVLDSAEYVHVKGKRGNDTDIMVHLHKLKNPNKETNFENCVADVNIPVGEVFTSPVLKGTNGTLHVKDIYLRNLRFYNLKLTFKNGMVKDYSCTNHKTVKENRKYIEENLLMPHKTLPIGEFAIGTNTLAYKLARKYNILALLPILIIEKMGPHFAIGDTCYSREEDFDHFNFVNGKKIIAVENEKSAKRKKDPLNAYTQVHTDITLPYDMLQSITAIRPDGTKAYIIKNGLFAVKGTEELNIPLLEMKK
jgi:leucyl aminopeptidase (aminopeptidase T)